MCGNLLAARVIVKGRCVRNLLFILPVIVSAACSFSNTPLRDNDAPTAEHMTRFPANDNTPNNLDTDNDTIIHTAMSPIVSSTPLTTVRQQLRADPQWNALANEVIYCVQALSVDIEELKKQSLYIAPLENPSSELKAFRSMVMTKLVQNGFSVTFNTKNAYRLKYDIISKELDKELNKESNDELVVRVAVIGGGKIMTKSRELPSLADSKTRKEILRVVRKHYF